MRTRGRLRPDLSPPLVIGSTAVLVAVAALAVGLGPGSIWGAVLAAGSWLQHTGAALAVGRRWLWGAVLAVGSWLQHTGPGLLAQLVSIATLLAVLIAWRQLVLSRNMAGGRLFHFNAWRQDAHSEEDDGITYEYCIVEVKLTGPAVMHSVAVHLEVSRKQVNPRTEYHRQLNVDSRTPETKPTMTATDEPIFWTFWLPVDVIPHAKVVLSWVETVGAGVRTAALRQNLTTTDVEQWRWFIGHRYRSHFRRWARAHGPQWIREHVGKPRPLGKYAKVTTEDMSAGEGPFGQP